MEGQFLAQQGFVTYSGAVNLCRSFHGDKVWSDWKEAKEQKLYLPKGLGDNKKQKAVLLLTDSDSHAEVSDVTPLFIRAVPWDIIHHGQGGFAGHRNDPSNLSCTSGCGNPGWS